MKTRMILLILLAQLIIPSLTIINPVSAQGLPTLEVTPASYTAPVHRVDETFTINITISNLEVDSQAVLFQFRLGYNNTLLDVVDVSEGPFLKDPAFAPYGTFFTYYVEDDPIYGPNVFAADLILPNDTGYWNVFPYGNGTIATITFTEIFQPFIPQPSASCVLKMSDTLILDQDANAVSHGTEDGLYEVESLKLPLLATEPIAYDASKRGDMFQMNVTMSNLDVRWSAIMAQFRLSYNSTLLQVVNVTEGPFLQNPAFAPYGTFFISTVEDDPIYGPNVLIGDMLLPNDTGYWNVFPYGNGTIATITFKAIAHGTVEPKPPANWTIGFMDTKIFDDQPVELLHNVSSGLFYQIAALQYPVASFDYKPLAPSAGQVVFFNASQSYDPDYTIKNYTWNFGDGIVETTESPTTTHVFAAPAVYDVTLTVQDIDALANSTSALIRVGMYPPFDVNVDAGSIYFKGEIAEFNILTTEFGEQVNATKLEAKLYFDGVLLQDLSSSIEYIDTGFYRVQYTIPIGAQAGTYSLVVKAEYYEVKGTSLKSFQISPMLTTWGQSIAQITEIRDGIATLTTGLNTIQANLTYINARLTSIEGNIATIGTSIGLLQTSVANINATISGLIVSSNGEILARIDSSLGTLTTSLSAINATITSVNGNVVTLSTSLGDVTTKLDGVQSTATTTLYATSILSAIAVILALVILMFIRKK